VNLRVHRVSTAGSAVDYRIPSSAMVKNGWSYVPDCPIHHQGVHANSFALYSHLYPLTVGRSDNINSVIMDVFVIINVTAPANGLSLFHNFSIPFKSDVELVTSAFFWGLPKITQASQVLLSAPINI
jgi:hypothetical protein